MVLESEQFRDNLDRVYINEVQPVQLTHVKKAETKSRNNPKIFFFRTYIDAAVDAYKNNLIRLSGLRRVMIESVVDFTMISQATWEIADHVKDVPPREVDAADDVAASGGECFCIDRYI
jgi:hypothetical protein